MLVSIDVNRGSRDREGYSVVKRLIPKMKLLSQWLIAVILCGFNSDLEIRSCSQYVGVTRNIIIYLAIRLCST